MTTTRQQVNLTHHFKIWFGHGLKEQHVQRFIQHKLLNPNHNLIIAVNKQVLEETDKDFLQILKKHQIEVVDINTIIDKQNLEEQRLLYVVNELIKLGYETNRGSRFAAASDVARWLPSLIQYKCKQNQYRIYTDTDYFFDEVPDSIDGEYLFGTSDRRREIFIKSANVDFNLIAIPANHELAKQIRKHWVNYFNLNNFLPLDFELQTSPKQEEKKSEIAMSLDFEDEISTEMSETDKLSMQNEIQQQIQIYGSSPGVNKLNVMKSDVEEALTNPMIVSDQRMAEARIFNLREASWVTKIGDAKKSDEVKKELLSLDEAASGIKLKIGKNAQFKEDLLRFLTLAKILNDPHVLEKKETFENDFEIMIPIKQKDNFLNFICAFVMAKNIPNETLDGNLKQVILFRNTKFDIDLKPKVKPEYKKPTVDANVKDEKKEAGRQLG